VSKGKRRLEARILFKFHAVLYAAGTFQTSPNTARISSQEVVIVLGEQCFMVCLSLGRMMASNEQIINFHIGQKPLSLFEWKAQCIGYNRLETMS
jgi:hypothetical protein